MKDLSLLIGGWIDPSSLERKSLFETRYISTDHITRIWQGVDVSKFTSDEWEALQALVKTVIDQETILLNEVVGLKPKVYEDEFTCPKLVPWIKKFFEYNKIRCHRVAGIDDDELRSKANKLYRYWRDHSEAKILYYRFRTFDESVLPKDLSTLCGERMQVMNSKFLAKRSHGRKGFKRNLANFKGSRTDEFEGYMMDLANRNDAHRAKTKHSRSVDKMYKRLGLPCEGETVHSPKVIMECYDRVLGGEVLNPDVPCTMVEYEKSIYCAIQLAYELGKRGKCEPVTQEVIEEAMSTMKNLKYLGLYNLEYILNKCPKFNENIHWRILGLRQT